MHCACERECDVFGEPRACAKEDADCTTTLEADAYAMRDCSGMIGVAAGCSLVLEERGERIVVHVKAHRVHVGLPHLQ